VPATDTHTPEGHLVPSVRIHTALSSIHHINDIFFPSSVKFYIITLFTIALHVSALRPSSGTTSLLLVVYLQFSEGLKPLKTKFLHNFIYKSSSYLTGNTLRLHFKAQQVNAA
jgi:hypothetical protein